jgi:8-oxo-dGTP pyrophosphatase MutT (NUDIX family)
VRSGVVIVHDGKVALIKRVREGRLYYVFPGGGVEPGETLEAAAAREAHEELGLYVRIEDLLLTVDFFGPQHFFRAAVLSGELGTGTGPELVSPPQSRAGSYHPMWVELTQLPRLDVRPAELVPLLL